SARERISLVREGRLGWRHAIVGGLAWVSGCATSPPPASFPNDPSISRHSIALPSGRLSYTAEAGLMPIVSEARGRVGDMSYFAYTRGPRSTRPVAFVWNGGPGSNSSPLHYGAFGPQRFEDGKLIANPATLVDVADLVFIDQMETGYGRIAEGVDRKS